MSMANSYFKFKQFTIWHDRCAMKVGTDAVLLGAWSETSHAATILDIGTGTGILALMTAQKSPNARIDGIDTDAMAIDQATENVQLSPWSARIVLKNQSWQQFFAENDTMYDLVICNPPFFQQSLTSPNRQRTMARHDDAFQMISLLQVIPAHLNQEAHFDLIFPYLGSEKLIEQAASFGLHCQKQTFVKSSKNNIPRRCLLSFSKKFAPLIEDEIVIDHGIRHHYTSEYKNLTKEFYLNF